MSNTVVEVLHQNEWVSLCIVRNADAGVDGYVYSRETRCQGRIVAVLPYRTVVSGPPPGNVSREYLLKSEMTPCWGFDQVLSAITGGYEGGDIEDDAVREMLEETGYAITRDELIPLGGCYASKSADTVYSLFSVDLTGRTPGEAVNVLELEANCWDCHEGRCHWGGEASRQSIANAKAGREDSERCGCNRHEFSVEIRHRDARLAGTEDGRHEPHGG